MSPCSVCGLTSRSMWVANGKPACSMACASREGASQAQAIAAESRRDAATLTASLMADVEAGIRVLRTRDGVALTDAQIRDRAANVVSGLLGNYRIEPLTGVRYAYPTEEDFQSERRIR